MENQTTKTTKTTIIMMGNEVIGVKELIHNYRCSVNPKAEGLGEASGLEVSQPHGDHASGVIGVGW